MFDDLVDQAVRDLSDLVVHSYQDAASFREVMKGLVAKVLQEGMRDAPLVPSYLCAVRETAERVKKIDGDTDATFDILELFHVIDHQAARIAALVNDSGQWQDGYRAGRQDRHRELMGQTSDRPSRQVIK